MNKTPILRFASIICGMSFVSVIFAQPLTPAEQFRHFVPVDKNLPPELVPDLLKRGSARVYRGDDLKSIAMPVGGITAGTFYLGGDGTVTVDPLLASEVDHGFAVVAEVDGNTVLKELKGQEFSDIEFTGEYPIGKVRYTEEGFLLNVEMEAFSPFIPLNAKQSALPGTLLHITVENTGEKPVRAGVLGWLRAGSDDRVVNQKNRTMIVHPGDEESVAGTNTLVLALEGESASSHVVGELLSLAGKESPALATQPVELAAGEKKTFTFALSWFFPTNSEGNEYFNRFESASEVAHYLLDNHQQLAGDTRTWHRTFYEDSTLPHWLLVRLHSTASTLATGTCQWRKNGRFWGWEGERSHGGTCIHVWHYAHSVARLFPELERSAREMQDFAPGIFSSDTGLVSMRGEYYPTHYYAADGQCGTVLRAYREHQMSADRTFLERNWPHIKKALEFSINHDANEDLHVWRDELGGFPVEYSVKEGGKPDGLIEGMQPQTWDGYFHGPNTMVGSLYLAALRAGEEMAREMGDEAFAEHCKEIFESGSRLSIERLWDGEYFIQLVDLDEHEKGQYGQGCNSDQLFGQGWAHQVGLGYIYPEEYVKQALQSVYKYNWAPDVGPQHAAHPPFRAFADPGEAGLFTCTWPKSENMDKLSILGGPPGEVFTGIEYQVAGNMVWEGLLTEAVAILHGIDERYQPPKRNPFNEVEAGNHYSRAMASWGVFTALAGYEYHGPKGHLGFAPRLTPENFQSAFTAAEGWGSFTQKRQENTQRDRIEVRWGKLRLESLAFAVPGEAKSCEVTVTAAGKAVQHSFALNNGRLEITLSDTLILKQGHAVDVIVSYPDKLIKSGAATPDAVHAPLLIPRPSMPWDDSLRIVGHGDKFHNDFTLLKDGEGSWHCIGTGGRDGSYDTLFHAVGASLHKPFEYLPKITSQTHPEAVHMWAPFAIRKDDKTAYLYFSHLRGSLDKYIEDRDLWDWGAQFELRLMVSRTPDLRTWEPYAAPGLDRENVVFRAPTVRDPCIFWDEQHQRYFMYYSAVIPARGGDGGLEGAIRVRTSKDLIYWSAARTAMTTPPGYTLAESAFVLPRDGRYYLWVCGYDYGRMSLYISETPFDFGDPVDNRIMEQSGHTPEIVTEEGVDYMACARVGPGNLEGSPGAILLGIHIQPIAWSPANAEEASKVYRKKDQR